MGTKESAKQFIQAIFYYNLQLLEVSGDSESNQGKALGIDRRMYLKWKNGESATISLDTLTSIAEYHGQNFIEFVKGIE